MVLNGCVPYRCLQVEFARVTGLRLLWDLNPLGSRLASGKGWDATNTVQLFQHIVANGQSDALAGFQFGNEPFLHNINRDGPSWVSGSELAADFKRAVAARTAAGLDHLPFQAPDSCCAPTDVGLLETFVRAAAGPALPEVSFHHYANPGAFGACPRLERLRSISPPRLTEVPPGDTPTGSCDPLAFISPGLAQASAATFQAYVHLIKDSVAGHAANPVVVLSETAGKSAGGCPNVTDAFVSTLWWIDWLGLAAESGIGKIYRQKLIGADHYDLITVPPRAGYPPFHHNPDFYTTLLWRMLMGSTILHVGQASATALATIRAHASCTPPTAAMAPGAVTIAVSNWGAEPANVEFVVNGAAAYLGAKLEYILTSAGTRVLNSRSIKLNGVQLAPGTNLSAAAVKQMGTSVTIPPFSAGFAVLVNASASVCYEA